jgi:gluconate 5-dehydrogenase
MSLPVAITARKRDELDAAAGHLKSLGVEALPLVCDMGKLVTIAPMVEQIIAALGPIDILANNAGTSWGAPTTEHPLDGWNKEGRETS